MSKEKQHEAEIPERKVIALGYKNKNLPEVQDEHIKQMESFNSMIQMLDDHDDDSEVYEKRWLEATRKFTENYTAKKLESQKELIDNFHNKKSQNDDQDNVH